MYGLIKIHVDKIWHDNPSGERVSRSEPAPTPILSGRATALPNFWHTFSFPHGLTYI